MFNFFKKKKVLTGEDLKFSFNTDIHSHILPGIDDGSPDLATSLRLVKGLYDMGIRKTIATPHVIADLYRNTPETINAALDILKPALIDEGIDIELAAAAEYMMDDYFLKLMRSKQPMLTIKDNLILTEQSYATPTSNINEICFELITAGYRPILAHPERYFYYHSDLDNYQHLKDMGFLFQVNLLSLTGYYGKPVAKVAKFLFEENMVDYVGTDLHHERHLAMLQHPHTHEIFHQYLKDKVFNEL
jgi:hypothetical protein